MNPRLLKFIQLTSPEHAHEELAKLYNARESEVSVMHPLEVFLSRESLIAAIEANLAQIHANLDPLMDELTRDYIEALIQQRVDFLERLRADPNDTVFVAMYPATSEEDVLGLDEEDFPKGPSPLLGPDEDDLPI